MPNKLFIKTLLERRIPHILGSYLVAGTSLILFIEYLVDKYQIPSHYPTLALFALLGIFPSVVILAYFHGAPGKDEWTKMEKIGVPVNVLFIASILFFGDSMDIWNINKDNIYDNSLDVHILYIGSPKEWIGSSKQNIEVANYLEYNIGSEIYKLDTKELDKTRMNVESRLLSAFYKQNIEAKMLKGNDEIEFMENAFSTIDNDRDIAIAASKHFGESRSIIFLIIYAIKNNNSSIAKYFFDVTLRVLPDGMTLRNSGMVDKGQLENNIVLGITDYVKSISKNKLSGYVTKVDGNIIYINPGGLELRENMNLLGLNIYNLNDKDGDGFTDKDLDWEIQLNDWKKAIEIIKESTDYTKSEIDRINKNYSILTQDSLSKIYGGQFFGENTYYLKVSEVIDTTIIAKLTELSNPWVEIRVGDLIILE